MRHFEPQLNKPEEGKGAYAFLRPSHLSLFTSQVGSSEGGYIGPCANKCKLLRMVIKSLPDARHVVQLIWCSCQSLLVHIIIGPFQRRGNWGIVLLSWKVKLFAQDYTARSFTLVPKYMLLMVLSHLMLRVVALTWTGKKPCHAIFKQDLGFLWLPFWSTFSLLMVAGLKAFWQLHTSQGQARDTEMFLSWGFQIWLLITITQRAFKNYRFPGPWAPGKIQTKQTQGGTWKSEFSQGPCGGANCQHRPDAQVLSVLGTTQKTFRRTASPQKFTQGLSSLW